MNNKIKNKINIFRSSFHKIGHIGNHPDVLITVLADKRSVFIWKSIIVRYVLKLAILVYMALVTATK